MSTALLRAVGASTAQADRSRFPSRFVPLLALLAYLAFPVVSVAEPVAGPAAIDPGAVRPDRSPSGPIEQGATPPSVVHEREIDPVPRDSIVGATGPALAQLLIVRATGASELRPRTIDEVLSVAVARGPTPELEPKKPFRKRNLDLLRTERRVEIGDSEMLVRLRLRAKRRETMSVEVRF